MRLLDLIAQGRCARARTADGRELPDASRFGEAIRNCPLRYVLSDELARCATQLAYAEGDRLGSCLDLVHLPARSLWIEWADGPRREALKAVPALEVKGNDPTRHGGAFLTASANCRTGYIRTFWSAPDELAYLSPIVTRFDLDGAPPNLTSPQTPIWRGETALHLEGESAIEELLTHLRYHFDDEWAHYYHVGCQSPELRASVLRASLSSCAFDAPMLMAFFLLLGARDLLPRQQISRERLNRVRQQTGRAPLLEHIEVCAPIDKPPLREISPARESTSPGRRLHHVRGHIVRRGAAVFWRSPHLRGSARLGRVRSRTVVLKFGQSNAAPAGRIPGAAQVMQSTISPDRSL